MTTTTHQPPSPGRDDWTSWQYRPDLAVLLFERDVTNDDIHTHITQQLGNPDTQPDSCCLWCMAGLGLGHWPKPAPESDTQ